MSSDAPVARRPLPGPDHVSAPYWDAAADGRLVVQRCLACGRSQFYPRAMCRHCAGETEWVDASGRGVVYSYSIVRQNRTPPFDAMSPYVVAMVDLAEGARMMGNVTGCDPDAVYVGMPVEVYMEAIGEGLSLPQWKPTDGAAPA